MLGADHHGYVARIRAAIEALGADPEAFEALIMNLVHIVEGGERAQMSKRSGDFVSLDELLDDIGVDATRWFMLWRSHETTVDLDLELARSQSSENPVYYVQYAHARIASILRKAGAAAEGAAAGLDPRGARRRARAERAGADQAPARVPRRGARVGGAAGAAPDLRLLDRGRRRLPRLLPRLPGGRRRGRGRRALAAGALPRDEADDRRRRSACSGSPPPSGCDAAAGAASCPSWPRSPAPPPGDAAGLVAAPRRPRGAAEPLRRLDERRLVAGRRRRGAGRGASPWPAPPAPPGRRTALLECDLGAAAAGRRARAGAGPGPARVPALGGDARREILQPLVLAGPAAARRRRAAGLHRRRPPRPPTRRPCSGSQSFRHATAKLRGAYDLTVADRAAARGRPVGRWRRSRREADAVLAATSAQGLSGRAGPAAAGGRCAACRRRPLGAVVVGAG